MARYRFLTAWLLEARRSDVWDVLHDPERWPQWWPGVERVERLEPGDADGVGSVFRNRWRSALPYTVEFTARTTRLEAPHLIEVEATGELAGEGRWRLFEGAGVVAVTYEWSVRTTPRWMNAVAPVARPALAWNHHAIMRRGGEGLARRLGTRLLARS